MLRRLALASLLAVVAGCPSQGGEGAPKGTTLPSTSDPRGTTPAGAGRSSVAADKGLEIFFEVKREVHLDRIPMRTVTLHFRNAGKDPLRLYLPEQAFRANISTLTFTAGGHAFSEPEPRPHGYVVTEADFPLLTPGEEKTFDQSFTLDPMAPGAGTGTVRRQGFGDGASVRVSWTYENALTRWEGGRPTLDGPTRTVFGGQDIPYLWRGRLTVETTWTVPTP
jgi:hypothetical protein